MSVKVYRKQPVAVRALLWDGGNLEECKEFLGEDFLESCGERHPGGRSDIFIKTLEGSIVASKGDYIIEGVEGEHYPCKPDIFHKTYIEFFEESDSK